MFLPTETKWLQGCGTSALCSFLWAGSKDPTPQWSPQRNPRMLLAPKTVSAPPLLPTICTNALEGRWGWEHLKRWEGYRSMQFRDLRDPNQVLLETFLSHLLRYFLQNPSSPAHNSLRLKPSSYLIFHVTVITWSLLSCSFHPFLLLSWQLQHTREQLTQHHNLTFLTSTVPMISVSFHTQLP